MAHRPTESHKRSKSSLALSILHRDRSKDRSKAEDKDGDSQSEMNSPTESPTASTSSGHRAFGRFRSHRHKHLASENGPSIEDAPGTTADDLSLSVSATNVDPVASLPSSNMTIEQSVRMFRLFEILRSGDSAAIAKAVQETSGAPATGDQASTSSSTNTGKLEGTTMLHLAIQCAEPQVVEEILSASKASEKPINIDAQDRNGNTPLHLASMLGRAATVRLLLEQFRANDSISNFQGQSPLDLARTPEIFEQLQLSRSFYIDKKVKEVHQLVRKADYQQLETLLEDGHVSSVLDVNGGELATDPSTIESGGTLLHEAARKKDVRLIQILLTHGADPFCRDRKGRLPQDVTKDDKTRSVLKRSPAAAVAQRGIQEKAILGSSPSDKSAGGRESREIKGYLKKWTNYTSGYKLRWFVLEDAVLSYYKHQDDAGSACRGAINMRIAKLYMDAQDKTRFEIQGKSSVKYHLKANHAVEAKRWFWALNNAIQWSKDEEKEDEKRRGRDSETLTRIKTGQSEKRQQGPEGDMTASSVNGAKLGIKGTIPATAVGIPATASSRVSFQGSTLGAGSVAGDDEGSGYGSYEPSIITNDMTRTLNSTNTAVTHGDVDDDEEYGDDASSHEVRPVSKDAFTITAQSATLQLSLLAQVSTALQEEASKDPTISVSDPAIAQGIATYQGAIRSLQTMIGDLLKISRDRDAYWQYRLDREADIRRFWEDSMAKVAKEQEELEGRIGESEVKRRRTKKALREALEGVSVAQSPSESEDFPKHQEEVTGALQIEEPNQEGKASMRRKSVSTRSKRKSTITTLQNLSDTESDVDEEFFDAIDAGEVEIVDAMPISASSPQTSVPTQEPSKEDKRKAKASEIAPSFKGYEEGVRKRLKMDADDRPKISLWGILKSMIGKDMTKMTLPVSFNEPTSLLQRVAEDMEYTDLLDTAADRTDSTERMVYVAAFAASEYASTIDRVAKPFNPLLGETYEYARPDKGYRFFIEQVSHHPPIGAAWAEAPKWDYYGESAVKSKFYGRSFDINPLGTWFLRLRPASGGEELYTWKKVTSSVVGIITGSPTVDNYGPMEVKNWTTGEVCVLDFKQRGWKASSAYQVSGKVVGVDGKTRWSIGGRWNDKIYARLTPGFEAPVTPPQGQVRVHEPGSPQAFLVWEAHGRPKGIPFNLTPFVVTLNAVDDHLRPLLPPTDTRLRPDQRAMEDGEYDLAATEKNRVEEKQRAKRREREANGEEFIPKWFTKEKCSTTGEDYWVSNGKYWQTRDAVSEGGKWEGVEDIFNDDEP